MLNNEIEISGIESKEENIQSSVNDGAMEGLPIPTKRQGGDPVLDHTTRCALFIIACLSSVPRCHDGRDSIPHVAVSQGFKKSPAQSHTIHSGNQLSRRAIRKLISHVRHSKRQKRLRLI
ncbi:MAG: hypothetical protein RIQ56_79 [Candidatus Parcubacteria bacterium]|jgi:hypothetical protein